MAGWISELFKTKEDRAMNRDVEKKVDEYLVDVATRMEGMPEAQKTEILQNLKSHIYETLAGQGQDNPTVGDVENVMKNMDRPEAYASGKVVVPKRTGRYGLIALLMALLAWCLNLGGAGGGTLSVLLFFVLFVLGIYFGIKGCKTAIGIIALILMVLLVLTWPVVHTFKTAPPLSQSPARIVVKTEGKTNEHGAVFFPIEPGTVFKNIKLGDQFSFEYVKCRNRGGHPVYAFNIHYNIAGKEGGLTDEIEQSALPKKVLSVGGRDVWIETIPNSISWTRETVMAKASDYVTKEGYDLNNYMVTHVELNSDDPAWKVRFTRKDSAPPGSNFIVRLDVGSGRAAIMPDK